MSTLDELLTKYRQKSSTQLVTGNRDGDYALDQFSSFRKPLSEEQIKREIEESTNDEAFSKKIDENSAHIVLIIDKSPSEE